MPAGTAMMEYPSIMMNEARILPNVDTGNVVISDCCQGDNRPIYALGNRREAQADDDILPDTWYPNKKPESIQRIKR